MGRRSPTPLTFTFRRRVALATRAGRLGAEHEALIALGEQLASDLDAADERRAPEVRAYLRVLERLGLAPPAADAGDLAGLLDRLRAG